MKKRILNIAVTGLLTFALSSCFSDDSSLGDPNSVPTINIAEIARQAIVSYKGNHLVINPEITSVYDDSQLQYTWYLYIDKAHDKDGFRKNVIGTERNLDYEVNLSSGLYVVCLEVKVKETGLAQYARADLEVSTEFSDGFYIMKQTEDGNTDIDLSAESGMSTDIIKKLTGAPLACEPVSLAMVYQQNYVNPDVNKMEMTNMLNIFTTQEYRGYRTEDMKQIFDQKSICYAGEDNDDVYYNMTNAYNIGFMLSKKGISSMDMKGKNSLSTGKFTLPIFEDDITKHVQMCSGGQRGIAYWSKQLPGVRNIDMNGVNCFDISVDTTGICECIASGINRKSAAIETVWFLAQEQGTGKRFLHIINGKLAQQTEVRELAPDLHISKATCVGACGGSAAYIYAIDGGKLYAYAWESNTEVEIPLPGVTEPVTFVTNQWLSLMFGDKFRNYDNLIVGTQNGNEYTLYFFDKLTGGTPTEAAYRTVSGTGKVCAIRRCTPSEINNLVITMGPRSPMPIFPTSE